MRSPWKKCYVDYNFKKVFMKLKNNKRVGDKVIEQGSEKELGPLFINNRAMTILKSMIGRKAGIHNGRDYMGLTIKDYMVGHKFGEYIATRKVGKDMHFRKKGRKVLQQNVKKSKKK
jgi:ribosomal protein S19